jgi:hypothetical protein
VLEPPVPVAPPARFEPPAPAVTAPPAPLVVLPLLVAPVDVLAAPPDPPLDPPSVASPPAPNRPSNVWPPQAKKAAASPTQSPTWTEGRANARFRMVSSDPFVHRRRPIRHQKRKNIHILAQPLRARPPSVRRRDGVVSLYEYEKAPCNIVDLLVLSPQARGARLFERRPEGGLA